MARPGKLTARKVATAGPGKYYDGGNLILHVRPSGSRSWEFRYEVGGRRRTLGLGPWPEVSLARARQLAEDCRRMLAEGTDPLLARRTSVEAVPTFAEAAHQYIETFAPSWSNGKHRQQWENTLKAYAFPVLGDVPVNAITTAHVLQVLRPIWTTKTETASRVRGRIEKILAWCAVQGHRSRENPATWRNHLDAILPSPSRLARRGHHRALPWQQVPAFMATLQNRAGIAARALEFAILTAARSGEVRGATWPEIDLKSRTWRIPPERMKGRREHRVPLSRPAVDLLLALPSFENVEFVFPSPLKGRQLSDMALLKVCRDLGVSATPHGFRSSFRDWCAERTSYPRELAELSLAHRIANKTEAAYWRSDLFERRRRLMEDWAAFCTADPGAGQIVPIGRGR